MLNAAMKTTTADAIILAEPVPETPEDLSDDFEDRFTPHIIHVLMVDSVLIEFPTTDIEPIDADYDDDYEERFTPHALKSCLMVGANGHGSDLSIVSGSPD